MSEIQAMLEQAELLYNMDEINAALDKLAAELEKEYADKTPLLLCVMNGAVITAGHLLPRLPFPLEIDYIHATRYGEKIVGGDLHWHAEPQNDVSGRHVILIEDIFDQGVTLKALREYCEQKNALSVRCVCLVDKQREGKEGIPPEYLGLQVPDRYVFGFCMDAGGFWRNLPAIYMLPEEN